MNIFGFRPFKGKFNLGNSDDIPENQDGTLIGSIKQINTALTANSQHYQASYSSGKYGFTINGIFYEIGGGSMPNLNYTTPLHEFTSGNLTYTATKECYLMGMMGGNDTMKINNKVYAQPYNSALFIPPIRLKAGDTVVTSAANSNLRVLEVAS